MQTGQYRNQRTAFSGNEGDNWGLISTSGKIEIPSGSFTRQPSAVVNGMFSLPDEKGYYQLYELKHPTHPTSARRICANRTFL